MNSPKRKRWLVLTGVPLSLILVVVVFRLNQSTPNGVTTIGSELATASPPLQAQTPVSQELAKDDAEKNSASEESKASVPGFDYSDMVRTEIHRSPELPVGVAFNNTLRVLNDLNEEEPTHALYYLQHEMGFDQVKDDEKSRELLNQLLNVLRTIDSEIKQENHRIGCSHGIPIVAGNQVYSVLEAIDDTPEIVAKKHLDLMSAELEADTAIRFEQWLESQKTKITQVKYNYREYFRVSGKSADARLASICNETTGEY